jgi:hypothetical protein
MPYSFNEVDQFLNQQDSLYSEKDGGWFRPEEGVNRIRIVSKFDVVRKHWDNFIRRSVVCVGKDKGCKYCSNPDSSANIEFLLWCIDRKDEKFKIAALNNTVIKAISDLRINPEYSFSGDFPEYDLIITKSFAGEKIRKDGSRRKSYRYSVTPSRTNSPLTDDEKSRLEKLNNISEIIQRMKDKVIASLNMPKQENLDLFKSSSHSLEEISEIEKELGEELPDFLKE